MEQIRGLELVLNDDHECRELIKRELAEVRDKFGDERRTDIDYTAGEFNAEDFYSDDDMLITISHFGYIKRTPLAEFRTQNRGGVGAKGSDTRDEDFIEYLYTASMHANILFFTAKGMVYKMKVYELPEGTKNSKGRAIQNLLNIEPDDSVNAVIAYKANDDENILDTHCLVFATRNGIIKKTSIREYAQVNVKGKKAIIIREGDRVVDVDLTDGNSEIILANRNGRAIRFPEDKVRTMGRVSTGVRGMTLDGDDDEVVGMVCLRESDRNDILVLSEKGYGKRTDLESYRITNRGGKGVKTLAITEKTGKLVAIKSVNDENDLVIINKSGITIRVAVSDIRIQGRNTQGVRIINLEKRNDTIASVCCVSSDPDEEVDHDIVDLQADVADDNADRLADSIEDVEADDVTPDNEATETTD